jgi:hypothetical protein
MGLNSTQKFVFGLLVTLATSFSGMVLKKLDNLDTKMEAVLVAQGVDKTELKNLKERMDRGGIVVYQVEDRPGVPERLPSVKEPLVFTNPEDRTRRKYQYL